MTLFRQVFVGVSLGFFLLLAGIQWIVFSEARTYLQQQLTAQAQDTATSLGMSLAGALEAGDKVLAETVIGPVFDRGYYQSIDIISPRGEPIAAKRLSPTPPAVPHWFTHLAELEPPTAESLITKGWRQLGRVVVTSHPNFAYLQLWHTSVEMLFWMAAGYVAALALLFVYLRTILHPLREIEAVAHAISNRDFRQVTTLPWARELRSVVAAMNSLSDKVRRAIEAEIERAMRFRDEAYTDTLTALGNRRGFEEHLAAHLQEGSDTMSGAVYMLEFHGFKAYVGKHGFHRGDELLQLVGATLRELDKLMKRGPDDKPIQHWRINGSTFATTAMGVTDFEAQLIGSGICKALQLALAEHKFEPVPTFNCGGAWFEGKYSMGRLLAAADLTMVEARARGAGEFALRIVRESADDVRGSQHWKHLIVEALAHDKFALLAQPVIALAGERRIQLEVVGRMQNDRGELITAAQFMPMAIRHDLVAEIDIKLLERLFETMRTDATLTGDIAVNLSVRSVRDPHFVEWLIGRLDMVPAAARRLVFELAEFAVTHDLAAVGEFVTRLRQTGARFAVDNFGLHRLAFDYLQSLKPEYVKLNVALLGDLVNNRENQLFISSIVQITRPLDVMTIANGVESAELLPLLKTLGIGGYQGYVTGPQTRIDS